MHKFVADQRQRELDGLPSPGARGVHGKPSIVTANTRQAVFHRTRRLLRGALESGEAERLGLDRGFITAMPAAGRVIRRSRPPFTDGVARALADEASLQALARDHDPFGRGLRDAWEMIIVTGRRCSEVLELRLDCLGRYGGLAMLWHDQAKAGNYGEAIRIPERTSQLLEARQRKTLDLFRERNNRPARCGGTRCDGAVPHELPQPRLPGRLVLLVVPQGLQELDRQPRHRPLGASPGPSLPGHQLAARRGQPDPHPQIPRPGL
jgi:integrase